MKTLKLLKKTRAFTLIEMLFSITNNKFIVNTYNSKYCQNKHLIFSQLDVMLKLKW